MTLTRKRILEGKKLKPKTQDLGSSVPSTRSSVGPRTDCRRSHLAFLTGISASSTAVDLSEKPSISLEEDGNKASAFSKYPEKQDQFLRKRTNYATGTEGALASKHLGNAVPHPGDAQLPWARRREGQALSRAGPGRGAGRPAREET